MPRLLIFLLLTSLSFAQAQEPAAKEQGKMPTGNSPSPKDVPMTATVLDIKGVCDPPVPKGSKAPCETKLTREQFETLWRTFNRQPGGEAVVDQPASIRKSMATAYGTMATLSQEARKRGLDRTPEFQLQMKVLRMQLLSKALQENIKKQYAEPSAAEVEKFYKDNQPSYQELSVHRLQIPKRGPPPPATEGKPASQPVTISAADAEEYRKRAAAGEDFDKLQKEVVEEGEIFALSPGSVTRVMDEGSSYVIYKVDDKRTLSLDEVRGNISRQLAEQNEHDAEAKIENSPDKKLSPVYFSDMPKKEPPPAAPAADNPMPPKH